MQRFKILMYALIIGLGCGSSIQANGADPANTDETKRVDLPFIHIGVRKHADGQKDVDVRAPFVRVHNPAGANNAQVKAPFTNVNHTPPSTQSQQPVTNTSTVSKTKVKQDVAVTKPNKPQ